MPINIPGIPYDSDDDETDTPVSELSVPHVAQVEEVEPPPVAKPLMLDVEDIDNSIEPEPLRFTQLPDGRLQANRIIDREELTPQAQQLWDINPMAVYNTLAGSRDTSAMADVDRLIFGRMQGARNLLITMPEQDNDLAVKAAKAGMTTDMVRYLSETNPEWLKERLEYAEIIHNSGTTGYITKQLQNHKSAQMLRYDAVLLSQMEADALGIFGSTADRIGYDLRVGFGQIGVLGVHALQGISEAILDINDFMDYEGDVDLSLGLGIINWHKGSWSGQADKWQTDHMRTYWRETSKDAEARWLGPAINTGNPTTDWFRTAIFQGSPFLAASVGLSLIPGVGQAGAAAIIGGGMGLETYGELRESGVNPLLSAASAGWVAVTSYYLNRFELGIYNRALRGASPFRMFSVGTVKEAGQEFFAESGEALAQGLAESTAKLIGAPGYTRDDWWRDMRDSAYGSFQEGAAAGTLAFAARMFGLPAAARNQAKAYVFDNKFKATGQKLSETTLYQSGQFDVLSDTLNGTARHHGGAGVVFASVLDLEQGGLSKKDVIEGLRISPDDYAFAKDHNVDLVVPFGDAAVFSQRQKDAGNDHFQNVFKSDPDAMTGREILAQSREMATTLDLAEKRFKEMESASDTSMPARLRIFRTGLKAAGFDANQADAATAVFWARADRAAELWGITPEEWLERKDVQLEFQQSLGRLREMNQYVKLLEQSRVRQDTRDGRTVDVFEAAEALYGSNIQEEADADAPAPETAAQNEVAQSDVTELMQPVADAGDNQAWVNEAVNNMLSQSGLQGEELAAAGQDLRLLLEAGEAALELPEVRGYLEQLGIPLPEMATQTRAEAAPITADAATAMTPESVGNIETTGEILDALYQPGENVRGNIAFPRYAGAPTIIRLFKNADVSTVIHELNHLFVMDLKQMVEQGMGGERAAADWAALAAFTDGGLESPDQKTFRDAMEKVASAWERYAMAGEAPSPKLAAAFDTFRTYMGRIYRDASQQPRFEASPEVRAVFDRFLATDLQLAEAKRLRERIGEWEDHIVSSEARRQRIKDSRSRSEAAVRRREDATRGGGRAMRGVGDFSAIRRRLNKEMHDMPVYHALDIIKSEGGMSRDYVEQLIGKPGAAEIARIHGDAVYGGNINLETTAEAGGYQTIEAMLSEMTKVGPVEPAIDLLVERELGRQDLQNEQQAENEGDAVPDDGGDDEAAHLELQVEEAMREEGAGARALREWRLNDQAAKISVARTVGAMDMHNAVDVRRYEKAKREAGRKAREAAAKGDKAKVTEWLKEELLQHHFIRECQRARAMRERVTRLYGTRALLAKLQGDQYSPRVENSFVDSIKDVATFMGFTSSRRTRPSVESDVMVMPGAEVDSNVAAVVPDLAGTLEPWMLNKIRPANFETFMDFTYDQVKEADRVLQMLIQQGRGQLHALQDGKAQYLEELVNQSIQPMERRERRPGVDNDDRKRRGQIWNKLNQYLTSLTVPEYWFMMMDGNPTIQGKEAGPNQRLFWKMRDCQLAKDKLYKNLMNTMTPHMDQLKAAREELEARFGAKSFVVPGLPIPEILASRRNWPTWDADMLLAIALNMGNDANIYALTEGYGLTRQQLDVVAGLFSADTWRAVQGVWDAIDSLYPQMDEVTFRITNRHVPKESAQALTVPTAGGEVMQLKGGYYPLVYDPLLSDAAQKYSNIEDAVHAGMMHNIHQSTRPANGMTKERMRDENGNPLVARPQLLRTSVLVQHLDAASHYITHAEALLEFDRLTRHEDWKREFTDKFGFERYRAIRNWVQDLARTNRTNNSAGQQIMEHMRTLATIKSLGLRPSTAGKQLLGLFQAANLMSDASGGKSTGLKWLKKGWRELGWGGIVGRKTEKMKWVDSVSDYMSARSGAHNREINAMIERISPMENEWRIPGTKRKVNKKDVHNGMFAMIGAVDNIGAYSSWIGGYEQGMAGQANFDISNMTDVQRHEASVRYADSVAATQASSFAADLTAAQRDTGFMRFVSMFMSGNVRQGSRLMQYLDAYRMGDKTAGDVAWLGFREFVAPALAWVFVASLLKYGLGDDDDDLFTEAAWEVVETSVAPFPIAREIPSAFRYQSKGSVPALAQPLEALYKGARATGRVSDGEYAKAMADFADAAGFWFGVPVMNPIRDMRPLGEAAGLVERKRQ